MHGVKSEHVSFIVLQSNLMYELKLNIINLICTICQEPIVNRIKIIQFWFRWMDVQRFATKKLQFSL